VSGELSNALLTWDLVLLLAEDLRLADGGVTPAVLIDGLERIRRLPIASGGDVSFEVGAHWGIRACARSTGTRVTACGSPRRRSVPCELFGLARRTRRLRSASALARPSRRPGTVATRCPRPPPPTTS
jgi:hypothetical protein